MLEHGGNLIKAADDYGIPVVDWLDLSTGINPNGWPVPTAIPSECWSQLPNDNDGLLAAAQRYYQTESVLPVSGSQAAIQMLPQLRKKCRVGIITPAYAEHFYSWQRAGHEVIELHSDEIDARIDLLDVLIIINPNNPTAEQFTNTQLLNWHQQLAQHDGWLIIDEAFIDTIPEHSLTQFSPQSGLIIFRSLGKFFGLAGLRVGFVFAETTLLSLLKNRLGPWPIAGPSRYIAHLALTDTDWQQQCQLNLIEQSQRLKQLLIDAGLPPTNGCALFQWVQTEHAYDYQHALSKLGILTRRFNSPPSLRFGLAKNEHDWQRLQTALSTLNIGNS